MTTPTEADIKARLAQLTELKAAIGQTVVGQNEVVEQLLVGLLAGGHCLIEGVPGLGKTLLVRTLGQALALEFRRVQFTPDLMPSDILGTEVMEEDHGTGRRSFRFQPGPVFTNLLLADELNRTPPKTQAALLEAMQEHTVSYAGTTYRLEEPPARGSAGPVPAEHPRWLSDSRGRARHPGPDHRRRRRHRSSGDDGDRCCDAAVLGAAGSCVGRPARLDHRAGARHPARARCAQGDQ
jgi:MoxR-like ATPase